MLNVWPITLTERCPNGYVEKKTDFPNLSDHIGSELDLSRQECAEKCNSENGCMYFHHSDKEMKCNTYGIPHSYGSTNLNADFVFCAKIGKIIDLANNSIAL